MGLLDSIGKGFSNMDSYDKRNLALNLASGFAGMSGNPNAPSIMAGIEGQQAALAKSRDKTYASDKLASQSAMAIKMLGDKFPMLTQALQAGIISPNDAITAARKGADVKVVGKSLVDSLGNVLFTSEDAGSGSTTAFDTLKLRAKDAGLEEGTPEYQQFMIEGGAKKGMVFTSDGKGGFTLTQGGGASNSQKLTEGQGKNYKFFIRGENANNILGGLEQQGTSLKGWLAGKIPLGNIVQTPEYRQYTQARDAFIMSILRDESGAVIGTDEYWDADRRYMPQAGDDPATIDQKRKDRLLALKGLDVASAGAVQANAGSQSTGKGKTVKTYDAQGNLISG